MTPSVLRIEGRYVSSFGPSRVLEFSKGFGRALELAEIQALVSGATNRTFRPCEFKRYPIPREKVKWFLYSDDVLSERKMPYVHAVWVELDDTVHIETAVLGDTIDMIEWIYGDVPHDVMDMNYAGLEMKAEVWEELKRGYLQS